MVTACAGFNVPPVAYAGLPISGKDERHALRDHQPSNDHGTHERDKPNPDRDAKADRHRSIGAEGDEGERADDADQISPPPANTRATNPSNVVSRLK